MESCNRRLIIGIAALAVLLMLAVSVAMFRSEISRIRAEKQRRAKTMGQLPDFSLVNQSGRSVTRSDLLGHVIIVDFVFTRCQGPCPALSDQMARLQDAWFRLPEVKLVSISVDPEWDKPEVLSAYAERYGAKGSVWHFLTGEKSRVYDLIRNGFRASVEVTDGPHQILHSTQLAVVDKRGRIRAYLDGDSPTLRMDATPVVRRLLAEN